MPKAGIVYFLRCRNRVKIGFTRRDLDTRVRELQTGNPHPITLDAYIETDEPEALERFLHLRFRPYLERGEWYYLRNAHHDMIRMLIAIGGGVLNEQPEEEKPRILDLI